jgi:hypothetical protein
MDVAEDAKLTIGKRIAALPLVVMALIVGNVLGIILITLSGYNALDYEEPGGALLGAAQGWVGAYLAFFGCQHFLKDHRYASMWLAAYVILIGCAILFGFFIYWLEGRSLSTAESWQTVSGIANAAVIEITRRTLQKDGI